MRGGRLDQRVVFEEPVMTQSASGELVPTWTQRFTVWAEVSPLRGSEYFQNDNIRADMDTRITVRRSTTTDAVTPKWRITHRGVIYNIFSIAEIRSGLAVLEIMARSGVNDG